MVPLDGGRETIRPSLNRYRRINVPTTLGTNQPMKNEIEHRASAAADPVFDIPQARMSIEADTWRTLKGVPMSFRLVLQILAPPQIGGLTVVLPDGRALQAGGRQPGPDAVLIVRDFALRRERSKAAISALPNPIWPAIGTAPIHPR